MLNWVEMSFPCQVLPKRQISEHANIVVSHYVLHSLLLEWIGLAFHIPTWNILLSQLYSFKNSILTSRTPLGTESWKLVSNNPWNTLLCSFLQCTLSLVISCGTLGGNSEVDTFDVIVKYSLIIHFSLWKVHSLWTYSSELPLSWSPKNPEISHLPYVRSSW